MFGQQCWWSFQFTLIWQNVDLCRDIEILRTLLILYSGQRGRQNSLYLEWKWCQYIPPKGRKLFTNWHDTLSQNVWIFTLVSFDKSQKMCRISCGCEQSLSLKLVQRTAITGLAAVVFQTCWRCGPLTISGYIIRNPHTSR